MVTVGALCVKDAMSL